MNMQNILKNKSIYFVMVAIMFLATMAIFAGCGDKKVANIEVTSNPTKTTYYVGEYFDTSGMVLTAEYKDGTKDSIKFADNNDPNNDGYTYDKYKVQLTQNDTTITFSYGGQSTTLQITVLKKTVLAPKVEDIKYYTTSNSITITSLSGAEYKLNDGIFVDSNTFGDLRPGQTYTITVRYKETDANYASPETSISITTSKELQSAVPESAFLITKLSPTSIEIEAVEGAEYSINGGSTWQDSNIFEGMTPGETYDVSIRMKETDTKNASAVTTKTIVMDKAESTAPASVTTKEITATIITINAIEGAEYRLGEEGQWQDSNVFSGLENATEYTIYVRIKETATHNASIEVSGTFTTLKGEQEAVSEEAFIVSVTDTTITITAIEGAEYRLDDGEWVSSNVFTGLTTQSTHTVYVRMKETLTLNASAEISKEVTLN